uniref:Uncharacterized protein n=1 Tax=Triticum urartu TaxID=4572 RepID=A0A8R7P1D9_TRIUA
MRVPPAMSSIDASAYLLAGSGVGAGAGVAVSFRPGAGGRSPRSVPNLRNSCARYPASSLLLPPWGGGVGMVGGLLANRDSWCGLLRSSSCLPGGGGGGGGNSGCRCSDEDEYSRSFRFPSAPPRGASILAQIDIPRAPTAAAGRDRR